MKAYQVREIVRVFGEKPTFIRDRRNGQVLRVINITFKLARGCPYSDFECVPTSDTTTKPHQGFGLPNRVFVPVRRAETWAAPTLDSLSDPRD